MARKIDEKHAPDVSRRNILLGGTTLAAASALSGNAQIAQAQQRPAQAQQPVAPSVRRPNIFDLRSDPYERADVTSNTFYDFFMADGAAPFLAAQSVVAPFLATFKEFPPSQRPSSFSIDRLVEKMQKSLERAH